MEQQHQQLSTTRNERRSMALSALIMSLVSLFCAFISEWRTFSIVVSGAAFIVSVFVLTKVRHAGPSKSMSVSALIISIIAAACSVYFLTRINAEEKAQNEIPAELHDSSVTAPDKSTLDRLNSSMDSSQTGK
jgi:hypothetical protein